ncbi:Uncharacterized conserved protein, DUF885 familyt [Hymenobacter gelipurpurascens]|uniref:Uncharacterized conserved protein, DUF885 familyt n=1 Tax=Hymenobacter gelipurpurascens TaxID=89968 RepID=A0A212TF11_9BACT|nr:DUF885 domain-containing protein [Hymenobacter gelipurpurascens]SNC64658.1 Uncharacterized conserved protein, DUF885 familyt [Hymenobacter gelipurpurascens]
MHKNYFFRPVLAAALSGLAALGACSSDTKPTSGTSETVDADFDRYKQRFIDSLWYYNPEWASGQGYHRYDSLLVVPNAGRRQTEAAALKRRAKEMAIFKVEDLSVNNQTDYRLLQNYLESARFYADTLRDWQWNPANYNLGGSVAEILNGRYQPLDRRLRSISLKISRAADYYEAAKTNIKQPTREHTNLAIQQTQGGLDVFGKALQDSIARSGLSAAEKKDITDRIATTRLVMDEYVRFLQQEVLPAGKFRSFRLSKPLFDRKFALDIQSSYSADEVYKKAQQHRQELLHDMGKRAARLWPKYFPGQPQPTDSVQLIKQVITKLSEKHATPAGFVQAVKDQMPTLVRWVDEHKLLTQDPTKPLVVRETPLYMRGSGAGASISAPGPYDKTADTYYNVEPLTGWPMAQAESYLREYNQYTLQILNIHEAIPGHYTQLVYANRSPSLVKAIFGNGAMIEGWAVYAERMMLESGYGGNTDEIWLMWDKWNMRVTLNTILDHEVHVNNISEQAAVAMLLRDGFQEEAEARNKWRRATLSQVQLSSYFTGSTEIYDLREELKKRDASAFDLKTFHEKFLSYGSAPVKYIRQMMTEKSE